MPWKTGAGKCTDYTSPSIHHYRGIISNKYLKVTFKIQKKMTFLSPELGRFRPSRLEEDSVTVRRPSRYTWQHWGIQGARNVDSWWWNTRTNPHEMPVTMVKQWLVKTISTVEIFTSQVQHETMEKSKFWKYVPSFVVFPKSGASCIASSRVTWDVARSCCFTPEIWWGKFHGWWIRLQQKSHICPSGAHYNRWEIMAIGSYHAKKVTFLV